MAALWRRLLQYIDANTHQGSRPMLAAAKSPNADAGNIRCAQIRLHNTGRMAVKLSKELYDIESNGEKQWWNKIRQMW